MRDPEFHLDIFIVQNIRFIFEKLFFEWCSIDVVFIMFLTVYLQ